MVQWYAQVTLPVPNTTPADVWPALTGLFHVGHPAGFAAFEVVVCPKGSPFIQVKLVPTETVLVAGLNAVFIIQSCVAVGVHPLPPPPPPPPPPYGDVDPPHAASRTTPAVPSARVITLGRMEPPGWCVGRQSTMNVLTTPDGT